ncbi:hypothetical protein [Streptomyces boluensis]|uniref:Uncharacterized protein n=1 Tax=Streptomyces boluensis TaxID=1775135 RepID=A0A964UMI0_9ACTN|nr:hypothetical protein [Streptomyces boluensis]NBE51963.1 hypothetical protein [Streptomyces boluensis]
MNTPREHRTGGPRQHHMGRRLTRAALFGAVRGAAMTAGSAAMGLLVWWLRSH